MLKLLSRIHITLRFWRSAFCAVLTFHRVWYFMINNGIDPFKLALDARVKAFNSQEERDDWARANTLGRVRSGWKVEWFKVIDTKNDFELKDAVPKASNSFSVNAGRELTYDEICKALFKLTEKEFVEAAEKWTKKFKAETESK